MSNGPNREMRRERVWVTFGTGGVDPRSVLAFDVKRVQEAPEKRVEEPKLSPEERQLTRLYVTFATNVWRLRRQVLDTETGEPKEGFERVARYVASLAGALEDASVTIEDYDGRPYDAGDAVKAIAFEPREDLRRDEYVETLLPTVRWKNAQGKQVFCSWRKWWWGKPPKRPNRRRCAMARETIDFGIDLGTTNSAIAVLRGTRAEVVKNNLDADITPSAVAINRMGIVTVGMRAKGKLEDARSAEDAYIEFKRRMGTDAAYRFRSAGVNKLPEELSAEVLRSLRENVAQRLGDEIRAAAITIPAAFAQRQCEATKRAAEMSGFVQCPLLQEPVAASLAYGFQRETARRSFWMVFDFGGGTFDAAVMKAEDGDIQVVNHGGDNFLGGTDIDWALIERFIIPELQANYNLPDFRRGSARWRTALAKLKRVVEMAKVELSCATTTQLDSCAFEDADGEWVDLEGMTLTQAQVAQVTEPLIVRAAEKCRAVLAEKNLPLSSIDRVLLVGGPTLAPYFRDILGETLGVPLDHSVDPLTVVAQGAAIFAGTQRLDRALRAGSQSASSGRETYRLTLSYAPIGPDDDPSVNGEVASTTGAPPPEGCRITFVNRMTGWTSGEIPLGAEGRFRLRLRAVGGEQNVFAITVRDGRGEVLQTDVSELRYTIGVTVKAQITCNDLSVELAGNEVMMVVPKGTAYPFKKVVRGVVTNVALYSLTLCEKIIKGFENGGDRGRGGGR